MPRLVIPGKRISIENSDDILQYIYASQVAKNPEKVEFLRPTPESLAWEQKAGQIGKDLKDFTAYHVSCNLDFG